MRVACAQVRLDIDDPDASWRAVLDAVEDAAPDADVVVLPELANSGYVFADRAEARRLAEPLESPRLAQLAEASARHSSVIVTGWCERAVGGPFSSAVVLDAGRVVASYRKCHLWGTEKAVFEAGDAGPLVVDTSAGRLAVMVCYDLEFPEFVRRAAEAGADLVTAPVNWPLLARPAGERPLEQHKLQAYAGAYAVAIAVADRCGAERGQDWIGGSCIAGADGYLRANALEPGPGRAQVITTSLVLSGSRALGPHNDALTDRRPELY